MAEEQQEQDKTEKATPYKLREAKKRGQVAKSLEANSFLMLSLALGVTYLVAEETVMRLLDLCRVLFSNIFQYQIEAKYLLGMSEGIMTEVLGILALPVIVIMIGSILSNVVQTGPVFSFYPLKPDMKRINPISGLKRLFSVKLLFEAVKSLFKIVTLSVVAYFTIYGLMPQMMGLLDSAPERSALFLLAGGKELVFKLLAILFLIAFFDLLYVRWDYAKKMRMSKRDQKEEIKRREGDPKIRARIRELQQEAVKRAGSLKRVPDADVLITNPTHYSVAIKYDRNVMTAPQVTAKGAGELALKMREIAKKNTVPVVQNKKLARRLFKSCELETPIPEALYPVIAKILVKVFAQREMEVLVS